MQMIAFLPEQFIVHIMDWTLGSVAGWLIGRGGKGRTFGIVLAVIYGVAIAGSMMAEGPPDYVGPLLGFVAFGLMFWLGKRRARSLA